jgi:hypothetical protein
LNRYYAIREREFILKANRKPNSVKRKEMKEALRLELLRKTLLSTDLYEVAWLVAKNEVWFAGAGEKLRALFEELWGKTFGLGLRMLVPVTMALEMVEPDMRADLMELKPSLLEADEE